MLVNHKIQFFLNISFISFIKKDAANKSSVLPPHYLQIPFLFRIV